VIPMQKDLSKEELALLKSLQYSVGDDAVVASFTSTPAMSPFSDAVIDFLNDVSKELLKSKEAKAFPDVVTFGFWLRKASLLQLKERYLKNDENMHIGRGVAFHIAPSNVPVNYAYSLVSGLIAGNANIVRIPSKDFPQVTIINNAINAVLNFRPQVRNYIALVRYGRETKVNDLLSKICDTRIIWGGDATIAEIRKSPLPPRAGEVTFADRYSLAVIDSATYLKTDNKKRIAEEFYNDTYLTDQNACTSPRIVIWIGEQIEDAKSIFWENLHALVKEKYTFQAIQGVNKLTSSYLAAVKVPGTKVENHKDNLVVRVKVPECNAELMGIKDNSGYFFEYDCKDILELWDLCDDKRCQTIGYLGNNEIFKPLIESGVKGIDRIVPIGRSMDFELIWDGYDLFERLTRTIRIY
jgi:hypothetical protein